jgi:hypothetical protein
MVGMLGMDGTADTSGMAGPDDSGDSGGISVLDAPASAATAAGLASVYAVEFWAIDRVKPYPGNPRKNAEAVRAVAESIRRFGWCQPIVVDRYGVVVCGHTRLLAAYELGMKEVPIYVAWYLTDEQARAYRLADNKVAELADWDWDLLGEELEAFKDVDCGLELMGFELDEKRGGGEGASRLGSMKYAVIVDCKGGEGEQRGLLERFAKEGLSCRALIS